MKNDLKDSAVIEVKKLAKSLVEVRKDITKLTNLQVALETRIVDLCELYDIENDEISPISVQNVPFQTKIPLKTVLDVFPNDDVRTILDNVVATIKIDLHATEENLRFSGNLQEPIIKGIMKQLDKLAKETKKEVVLK